MNPTPKIVPTRVLRLTPARPAASHFFPAVAPQDRASFALRRLAVERAGRPLATGGAHDIRSDHDLPHAV
jgi:hypothetical protein